MNFIKIKSLNQKNRNILKKIVLKNNILSKNIKHNTLQLNNLRNFLYKHRRRDGLWNIQEI